MFNSIHFHKICMCWSTCLTFVIAQLATFCLRIMTFQLPLFWITLYSTSSPSDQGKCPYIGGRLIRGTIRISCKSKSL